MPKFEIKGYRVGPIQTNCYFMENTETKELLIVDPGDQADVLMRKIDETGAKPVAILLTHGHFDHVTASNPLREHYNIPVYAHDTEKPMLQAAELNPFTGSSETFEVQVDQYLSGEPTIELAGFSIRILHTPGHTPGGVCYYFPDEKVLFSGDTLFRASMGRTDFPGGSASQLVRNIETKLFTLPEDVDVFPGHEDTTNIGWEKKYNPFF